MDGLKILLDDNKSNLGWRIVSKFLLDEKDFNSLIKETDGPEAKVISEIASADCKREVNAMVKILKAIKQDTEIDKNDLVNFLRRVGHDHCEIARKLLKDEITSGYQRIDNPGLRKISIKSTTIQGSKGLEAEYVFITHFDDQYFIKNKDKKEILDQDICNFLVALTRAKRKIFLISSNIKEEQTFLTWINKERIDRLPTSAVPSKGDHGE